MKRDQEQNINEQQRQAELKRQQEMKKKKMQNMGNTTNIDEMPDCMQKYEMINQKALTTPGWKFTDVEFSHQ